MTYEQAKARALNPYAIVRGEYWLVLNGATGEPVQTERTPERARLSAQWCNEHEARCGRPMVYKVERLEHAAR